MRILKPPVPFPTPTRPYGPRSQGLALDPGGTLWLLRRKYTGTFASYSLQFHKNVVYDFQNYATYVCLKSELLDPKKSPTCCNFQIFDYGPQQYDLKITPCTCVSKANFQTEKKSHLPAVILKFLTMTNNLTINFKTHKIFFENF